MLILGSNMTLFSLYKTPFTMNMWILDIYEETSARAPLSGFDPTASFMQSLLHVSAGYNGKNIVSVPSTAVH